MNFVEDVVTNLVAGLLGTAILTTAALLLRRLGPERVQQCLDLSYRYIWTLLALGFLTSALLSAIIQGLNGTRLGVLGGVACLIALLLIARRFAPVRFRAWETVVRHHPWQLLTGLLIITTLAQIILPSDPPFVEQPRQLIYVVDVDPEEQIGLREILNTLEPQLGAKVFLMNVPSDQYVGELDRMVREDNMKWDLVAADNNMLGVLGGKCLVQDLERYSRTQDLMPSMLIPSLSGLYSYKGSRQVLFAPYRANVMVAFYNKRKFDSLDLNPPRDWTELLNVARVLKEHDGVGRVAIQGYPGKPTGVTAFEFVSAAGGSPLTLNGQPSLDAFQFLKELEPYLARDYSRIRFDTANRALILDRVDLVVNWTFGIKVVIEQANKQDIDVYPGWSGPAGQVQVLGGDVLAIPRGAPNSDKAAKLIQLLMSSEVQQKLLERLRWPPVRYDAYNGLPPHVQQMFDNAVLPALRHAQLRPTNPQWTLAEKELDGAFDALVRKQGSLTSLSVYSQKLQQIPSSFERYTVQSGDTLQNLATRSQTTPDILAGANGLDSDDSLIPGQVLLLPGAGSSPCP
jgi:trehalose transport system substrate-binding protein